MLRHSAPWEFQNLVFTKRLDLLVLIASFTSLTLNYTRFRLPTFETPEVPMIRGRIRDILTEHGRLSSVVSDIANDSDLYEVGLTSLVTVNLLLAIEDHFDIEFPDEFLSRRTFQSIDTLAAAVEKLTSEEC